MVKIAPVSADLMIKLALAAVVVGGVWYMVSRAKNAVSDTAAAAGAWVGETATNAIQAVNPVSTENVFYKGANWITGGDENSSIGGRIYDFFNPDPLPPPPRNTGGATGSW